MKNLIIRREEERDYRTVEELIRDAFWNVHVPGASEHFLAHQMRKHEDFVPELDLVVEQDGEIVGNIMYTVGSLIDENGTVKKCLSFGPLAVHPKYQRRGIGKALIDTTFELAKNMEYDSVIILGHPSNYVARGFVSCKKMNVCVGDGEFPTAMLVKPLSEGAFDGRRWTFIESKVCEIDDVEAEKYDQLFPEKEKKVLLCQEEFYIYSRSCIKL